MKVLKAVGIALAVLFVLAASAFVSNATWSAVKDEIASGIKAEVAAELTTRLKTVEDNVADLTNVVKESNQIQIQIMNALGLREALVDDDYDDPLIRPR